MNDLDNTEKCCAAFLDLAKALQARGFDEDAIQAGLLGAAIGRSIETTPHETATWLKQIAAQLEAARGKPQ